MKLSHEENNAKIQPHLVCAYLERTHKTVVIHAWIQYPTCMLQNHIFETPFWIYHHKSQQLGRWVHDKFTVTFWDNINRPAKKGIPNYCNNYGILAKPWSYHHHFKFARNLVQQIWLNFAMINSLRKAMADLVENISRGGGWLHFFLCNSLKNFLH
jgi:hypothetical protein